MQALIEELGSFCVLWSWQLSVTLTGLFLRPSLNVVGKHSRISPENEIKKNIVLQLLILGSSSLTLGSFELFLYPGEIWETLPTTFKLGLRKNHVKVMDNCELQWAQNNPNSLIRVNRIRIILRLLKLKITRHFDRIASSALFKRGKKTFPNFSWKIKTNNFWSDAFCFALLQGT